MTHFDENVKCRGRKKHFFSAAAYGDELRRVRKESMPQSALLLIEERKAEDFMREPVWNIPVIQNSVPVLFDYMTEAIIRKK